MINSYMHNRKQRRIDVLYGISDILGIRVKDLLIDNDTTKDK